MDTTGSLGRAGLSAAVFVGVAYITSGGQVGMSNFAIEAGIQSAAALVSDWIHAWSQMNPTWATSGTLTGLTAAAIKYVGRGDEAFLINAAGSAAVDAITDMVAARMGGDPAPTPSA
jgi:hypothetical protein